ncbi:MAG: ParM/StbA family protein [Firmicutes bacterium]|nr:ParM/StbA family protein [Bacillota bacterium]
MSVDVGYGYTKGLASGRAVSFPSVVRPAQTADIGVGARPRGYMVSVRRDGEADLYEVGELALVMGGRRSWETRAASRPDYAILALTAMRLAGAAGGVDLGVGLPLELYLSREEREALKARLTGLEGFVSVDDAPEAVIRVDRVRVFPQGAAAYSAAVAGEPALVRGTVGVVDVGYRTTDYLVMVPRGEGAIPDRSRLGSVQVGVGEAFEAVAKAVGRERATMLSSAAVERAVLTRTPLRLWGETVDLAAALQREYDRLGQEVAEHLRRVWEDALPDMAALLVCGGGGVALYPRLAELTPVARLVPEPVTANAAGYSVLLAQAEAVR